MKTFLLTALLCNVWAQCQAIPPIVPPSGTPVYVPNPETLNREFTDNGERLTEGDMVLTTEQFDALYGPVNTRKAINELNKRWTNGVVPYAISASSEPDRAIILDALQHWMDNSCIIFVEVAENADEPHLIFKKLTGCHSAVGMQAKNGQDVSIGQNCAALGTIAHEVGHALGFWHEQSRPERNQFVKLLEHNINKTKKFNFQIQNNIDNYGVPYDLGSIMHYGLDSFTINTRNTMVPLDIHRTYEIGQRKGLSFYDLKLANLMYKCADQCASKPSCRNGGFVDFDCSCRCPPGFSGAQCQTVVRRAAPICGGDFTGPATIKTPNYPNKYPKDVSCIWTFKAPTGQKVKVSFNSFDLIHYNKGDPVCHWDHLEVRAADKYEGDKYCAQDLQNTEITSADNEMALLFHSQYNWNKGFEAQVTFV